MFGLSRTGMVFKLTDPDVHARALALPGAHLFDPSGRGEAFRQWVVVPPAQAGEWEALAYEALGQDHSVPPEALAGAEPERAMGKRATRLPLAAPAHAALIAPLREPAATLPVAVDAHVLPRLEHDLVVAAVERLLRPPAVDDAPLLAHERDLLAVDDAGGAVDAGLDERRAGRVEAPRRRA